MCHLILLVPVFGLSFFVFLPLGEALILYSVMCSLSAIVYWLIWRAMRRPVTTGVEGMIGGIGRVLRGADGGAKVFYRGEIWDALSTEPFVVGESVVVVGFDRMKLVVRHKA